MHLPSRAEELVALEAVEWSIRRLTHRATPLPPLKPEALPDITTGGIGVRGAWRLLRDVILPSAFPTDHPSYLSFIPGAPSVASVLTDIVVSAAGVYAGSELEAGSVVHAERAALRWLADLAGLPPEAHGTFVSGGTVANLSALVTARDHARASLGRSASVVITGPSSHSSIAAAARVMDRSVFAVGAAEEPLSGGDVESAFESVGLDEVCAVVATAGSTNTGVVDDLASLSEVCARHGVWLHVDAAYGGGALLSPRTKPLFAGLGRADSITINPHKWLFVPFDCAGVLYRDPDKAKASLMQRGPYLDAVDDGDNPSDYAFQLTRRARGLPLWASLIANGTEAYVAAVERCLDLAQHAAMMIRASASLDLLRNPNLSIVVFRRRGWDTADYQAWSRFAMSSGLGLVTMTRFLGEPALRLCFVNPLTKETTIDRIVDSLA